MESGSAPSRTRRRVPDLQATQTLDQTQINQSVPTPTPTLADDYDPEVLRRGGHSPNEDLAHPNLFRQKHLRFYHCGMWLILFFCLVKQVLREEFYEVDITDVVLDANNSSSSSSTTINNNDSNAPTLSTFQCLIKLIVSFWSAHNIFRSMYLCLVPVCFHVVHCVALTYLNPLTQNDKMHLQTRMVNFLLFKFLTVLCIAPHGHTMDMVRYYIFSCAIGCLTSINVLTYKQMEFGRINEIESKIPDEFLACQTCLPMACYFFWRPIWWTDRTNPKEFFIEVSERLR